MCHCALSATVFGNLVETQLKKEKTLCHEEYLLIWIFKEEDS